MIPTRLISILVIHIILFCSSGLAIGYPTAKITAKVVDEYGGTVEGAEVHISFEVAKKGGWGTDNFGVEGRSDSNGIFSGQAEASASIGITVRKEGYYFSRQLYNFSQASEANNRWEPWNPTVEVVLKQKRNPVPMFMKGTNWIEVPAQNSPVGYDLEIGDWVAPYGSGRTNDFIFVFAGDIKAFREYDQKMSLHFSNDFDGIQEYIFNNDDQSSYKWSYNAPVDGYQKKLTKGNTQNPRKNGNKHQPGSKVSFPSQDANRFVRQYNLSEIRQNLQ